MSDVQQRPFSIRVFVPDGDPDGLRLVEKSNWTGVGVVFRRTGYKHVAKRPEFDRLSRCLHFTKSRDNNHDDVFVDFFYPAQYIDSICIWEL